MVRIALALWDESRLERVLTRLFFFPGFITFSDGPGGQIGNLYFATWISFLMSVFLFAGNFRDYVSGMAATTEENKGEHHPANPSVEQNIPDEEDI